MTSINISKNLNANIKTNTDLQGNLNQEQHLVGNITTANGVIGSLSTDNQLTCKLNHTQTLNTSLAIAKGDKGEDGYTPIKGIDYFTEEDISSLKDIFSTIDHTHKNKIDDVVIEGNILKFYADNVLIKEIKLPANIDAESRAVCGEFLCGELLVGEGLSVKARNEVFKWVDGVTPVNAENLNAIEEKLFKQQHYVGELPPIDTDITWYDTTSSSIDETLDSLIIKELKSIISDMSSQISYLTEKVEYLLNMQGGDLPGDDNEVVTGNFLLLENGDFILLEDSNKILLEQQQSASKNTTIITENGLNILTEHGKNIIKEGENGRY